MNPKEHWETIYSNKSADEVSWFQPEARLSLALITEAAPDPDAAILDVGGGASSLVDGLLAAGYANVTVLDLSSAALEQARTRLGEEAARVKWLEADIRTVELPPAATDVWHDRAVFHFLTSPEDRQLYVRQVQRAVRPGGYVLVATFADDGPERCSGLEVARYNADSLHAEFGSGFRMLRSERENHVTPWGSTQRFVYCLCRY
jgi:ubiquinone/menaquinone biosynthesis C-methylase UbiE